ncbi:Similar to carbon monoxide dehydrogenase corrinoid/iron-sulfur protein [hydrothermal vent metagenome]|uniref:Similar to carbon monoxide dehydrogenase corrinoid/iron-sulfur protein n=1 Tax=hydrothermal vent metagenome TaxID=652676 RepID=A0A3B1BW93_9ZZZZ
MQNTITKETANRPYIKKTDSHVSLKNRWDHIKARIGINRMGHTVEPGLYAIGAPDGGSQVFVTANYTLSFDALRSALEGISAYILVLDTFGVNVWCAAGKGTFNANELISRIEAVSLKDVVSHRRLILPQLSGPGIAARLVKKKSGFRAEFGPVRAADLPEYLKNGEADERMRQVFFPLKDRLALVPLELVYIVAPTAFVMLVFYFLLGPMASFGILGAVLAGTVLFPILLPILPGRSFSGKGFFMGAFAVAAPFALTAYFTRVGAPMWARLGETIFYMIALPPLTAFLALNFTGSTTFASPSGVKKEIFDYFPVMAKMFGAGLVLAVSLTLIQVFGGV